MATYTIKSRLGTNLYLNVYGTGTITGRRNVCLWTKTDSNDQKWSISSLGKNVKVYSMNNTKYALNARTDTWNCDVIIPTTDSDVNFVPSGIYFKIQLVSHPERFLTADGSSSSANVSWALETGGNNQLWDVQKVSTPVTPPSSGEKEITFPVGPLCNWNQKNTAVTQYFGSSACTLVCGLDVSNFYATNGKGYTPVDMNSTTFWKPGYTWQTLAGKILAQESGKTQEQLLEIIRNTINKGYPCIVIIGYNKDNTHAVVAYGYQNGGKEYKDISVIDPAGSATSGKEGEWRTLYEAMDYSHDYFNIYAVRPTEK